MEKNNFYKSYFISYTVLLLAIPFIFYICDDLAIYSNTYNKIVRSTLFLFPCVVTLISAILASVLFLLNKIGNRKNENVTIHADENDKKDLNFFKMFFIASLITTAINTTITVIFSDHSLYYFDLLSTLLLYYLFTSYIVTIFLALSFVFMVYSWPRLRATPIVFSMFLSVILIALYTSCFAEVDKKILEEGFYDFCIDEDYNNTLYGVYNDDAAITTFFDDADYYKDYTPNYSTDNDSAQAENASLTKENADRLFSLWTNPENNKDSIKDALETLSSKKYNLDALISSHNVAILKKNNVLTLSKKERQQNTFTL